MARKRRIRSLRSFPILPEALHLPPGTIKNIGTIRLTLASARQAHSFFGPSTLVESPLSRPVHPGRQGRKTTHRGEGNLTLEQLRLEAYSSGSVRKREFHLKEFAEQYGYDLMAQKKRMLTKLLDEGLLSIEEDRLVPTRAGLAVADSSRPDLNLLTRSAGIQNGKKAGGCAGPARNKISIFTSPGGYPPSGRQLQSFISGTFSCIGTPQRITAGGLPKVKSSPVDKKYTCPAL